MLTIDCTTSNSLGINLTNRILPAMRWFLLFLFISVFHASWAQQLTPMVISSTGTTLTGAFGSLEFTLGELAVQPLQQGSLLTQGFHQPQLATSTRVQNSAMEVTIYPNPFQSTLQIELENQEHLLCKLYNSLGVLVSQQSLPGSSATLDGSDLPPGMYYLELATLNGETSTIKLVKQ